MNTQRKSVRFILSALLLFAAVSSSHGWLGGSGTFEKPVQISSADFEKVEGTCSVSGQTLKIEVYNGSSWKLVDIDIRISIGDKSRVFRCFTYKTELEFGDQGKPKKFSRNKTFLEPYSKGVFEADIGDFFSGMKEGEKHSFRKVTARGFKE